MIDGLSNFYLELSILSQKLDEGKLTKEEYEKEVDTLTRGYWCELYKNKQAI